MRSYPTGSSRVRATDYFAPTRPKENGGRFGILLLQVTPGASSPLLSRAVRAVQSETITSHLNNVEHRFRVSGPRYSSCRFAILANTRISQATIRGRSNVASQAISATPSDAQVQSSELQRRLRRGTPSALTVPCIGLSSLSLLEVLDRLDQLTEQRTAAHCPFVASCKQLACSLKIVAMVIENHGCTNITFVSWAPCHQRF
jgi:hypothetical protein